jgi:hypothetical protein
MKRFTCLLSILLGLVAVTKASVNAEGDERSVTGAANGLFAAGTALGPVGLQGIELGTGVFIETDGSASGTFHAVLQGTSLGSPREVVVEGNVNQGSVAADGRATFSGTASLDLGIGAPPLAGVAFSVTAGANGVVLVIDSTMLRVGAITAGAIAVE